MSRTAGPGAQISAKLDSAYIKMFLSKTVVSGIWLHSSLVQIT